MRNESPAVAPFLRSDTQARLLADLLLTPDRARSITELARVVGAPQSVVSREVSRLVEAQVLADERVGRTRLIRANAGYRLREPLTQILAATFGPVPVLTRLLTDVPDVVGAYLYGSWAARFSGLPGRAPGDVDVLVVGTADRATLNEVAGEAEALLGLPVQITRISRASWDKAEDTFVRTVKSKPLVRLELVGEPT